MKKDELVSDHNCRDSEIIPWNLELENSPHSDVFLNNEKSISSCNQTWHANAIYHLEVWESNNWHWPPWQHKILEPWSLTLGGGVDSLHLRKAQNEWLKILSRYFSSRQEACLLFFWYDEMPYGLLEFPQTTTGHFPNHAILGHSKNRCRNYNTTLCALRTT